MAANKTRETLLDVRDLSVSFRMYDSNTLQQTELRVIHDLSVSVREGEIVAVAGSSGSGKSLLAHAILGILPGNALVSGAMLYRGEPVTETLLRKIRGRELAIVPQSLTYLDPLMKTGEQINGIYGNDEKRRRIFERYELDESAAKKYPFQLSGGMSRRILISTALMGDAKLIIADEPTPGMTLATAKRVMEHFRELADGGAGILLITHDIDLAFECADRIAVFYAGSTVEIADAADFRAGPGHLRHPYSIALWQAIPQNGFVPISGSQPYAGNLPSGCCFAPRCPRRTGACGLPVPMREFRGGEVRCVNAV
ncbi:MAG: ABC transporter ATP-binding protein [Spirochaetaceae bacterium]|jgi:peptide/nickel transport system ATP-binding protein|nr:ABC transporter ATP-binding protein [Spirochaetaceae bacterium]